MKMMIAAAALGTLIASPAFAQHDRPAYDQFRSDYGSGRPVVRQRSPNPNYDVYDTEGHYVGSDPDPLVRDELRRDYNGRGY